MITAQVSWRQKEEASDGVNLVIDETLPSRTTIEPVEHTNT